MSWPGIGHGGADTDDAALLELSHHRRLPVFEHLALAEELQAQSAGKLERLHPTSSHLSPVHSDGLASSTHSEEETSTIARHDKSKLGNMGRVLISPACRLGNEESPNLERAGLPRQPCSGHGFVGPAHHHVQVEDSDGLPQMLTDLTAMSLQSAGQEYGNCLHAFSFSAEATSE